jgi:16S rRNA (guanine527-N7)-methyltransferase
MPTLTLAQIAGLLEPYFPEASELLLAQLSDYLDLLIKWNARTNLSAIRTPAEIVQRHFGESLFAAHHLPPGETLLDLGSGAGFPGLPIALAHPRLRVTLAESQNKRASFLREVVRTLSLPVEVWAARAETFPATRRYDIVTLRAVDQPDLALTTARSLLAPAGTIVHLTSAPSSPEVIPIPGTQSSYLDFVH